MYIVTLNGHEFAFDSYNDALQFCNISAENWPGAVIELDHAEDK